jgi:hypothetical protein
MIRRTDPADIDNINEPSLSPMRGKGMENGGKAIALSIDKRDEPFNILICHAGNFTFVINRKQCYLNRVIFMLNVTFMRYLQPLVLP